MGYLYEMPPDTPLPIAEIQRRWVGVEGKQGYLPDEEIHGWYDLKDLTPYREYPWDATRHRQTDAEWQDLVESIRCGFDARHPILVIVGRNGVTKIGEGNHRIGAAIEAGYTGKIPVRFLFYQNVSITPLPALYRPDNPHPKMGAKASSKKVSMKAGSYVLIHTRAISKPGQVIKVSGNRILVCWLEGNKAHETWYKKEQISSITSPKGARKANPSEPSEPSASAPMTDRESDIQSYGFDPGDYSQPMGGIRKSNPGVDERYAGFVYGEDFDEAAEEK